MNESLSDGASVQPELAVHSRFDGAVDRRTAVTRRAQPEPRRGVSGGDEPRGVNTPLVSLEPIQSVLDAMEHPTLIFRSDSFPCVANAAAERLLEEDASAGHALVREIRTASRKVLRAPENGAETEVGMKGRTYRVRASLLGGRVKELATRLVMVTVERTDSPPPSRTDLIERFKMTAREADVALLLAQGARNSRIATELRISPHTARHHTESVLGKLNVHGRAEVARVINRGASAPSDRPANGR